MTICLFWLSSPAGAATIELLLVDELDQPISDIEISLVRDRGAESRWFPGQRDRSDPSGRVVFQGVEPGRYTAILVGQQRRFVEMEDHPSVRAPAITVEGEQDVVESRLRFVRGVPVVFRVSAGGDPLPWPTLVLHDLDREYRTEIRLRDEIELEVRLVPGRWTAQVQPVPGYLLTSVEVNRTELPGYLAEVDLPPGEQAWYINFEYAAPALIWGYVTYEGERFGVEIVARLEEPGPWLPAAQARGGSIFEYAKARPKHPKLDYEMVVPDGRWIVWAQGDQLEGADPEKVEIELVPGEERRIDFTVRGSPTDGEEITRVYVRTQDGGMVNEAPVEVWPSEIENRGTSPLAHGKTRFFGSTDIRGLDPETTYQFIAGGEGFVENTATVKPPGPSDEPDRVILRLKRGATVHAVAHGEDDDSISSIEVSLTRQDETSSLMAAPEILEWAQHPVGRTDDTGHLWLRGVYPGRYLVEGLLVGDAAARYFVEFRESSSDSWERSIERTYVNEETDEFELRLAPAAGVQATLHCSDGTAFPEEADILVLPGTRSYDGTVVSDWRKHAEHSATAYVLEGENRDRISGGPLVGGAYHVLVRPENHNRWTWALGTEYPREASVITAAPGDPTDLGAMPVDCAPAVAIRPAPPEGEGLPDLEATNVYDPIGEISGTITIDDRERRIARARTVATATEVQFRDLPEGHASLQAVVRSPFFLPHPELPVTIEATLERGKTVTITRAVAGIGGAIDIVASEIALDAVAAVRLMRETDEPGQETEVTIVESPGAPFLVPSLWPGAYRVELFADPDCEGAPLLVGDVDVLPGEVAVFDPR